MSREAYTDWSRLFRPVSPRADQKENIMSSFVEPEPIFVTSDLNPETFFSKVDKDEKLSYLSMERDLAETFDNTTSSPRVEALLFREPGHTLPPELCTAACDHAPGRDTHKSAKQENPGIAIIDDGIGFLNARFRSDPATSRFLGVWLQSEPSPDTSASGNPKTKMGRILGIDYIAHLMKRVQHTSETTLYREIHKGLHDDPRLVKTIFQAATHGTHVLDLAAGADPLDTTDPMRTIPLIAVQLPPEAVNDTSGTGIEMPLIYGLRWAILVALKFSLKRLVVNVSFGVLAGSKDGKSSLECRMAREIDRAARMGLAVDIVLPYGNDYENRQVARLSAGTVGKSEIVLRLQPQDSTPSYIEIRDLNARELEGDTPLRIGLAMPDGTTEAPAPLEPGAQRNIHWRDRLVARLHHLAASPQDPDNVFILAFAPTLPPVPGKPAAPPGAWRIMFEHSADQDIVLQVQRDDRATGYRLAGRQAYFDSADAYEWNQTTRDWTGLGDASGSACAIRHDGTNSAYTTSRHPRIHTVGGAMVPRGGDPRPARYASEGADWSGKRPKLSAVCEIALSQPGVIASGTLSGSTARFSGSSAAAPSHARALIMQSLGRSPGAAHKVTSNAERMGSFVQLDNPAIRRR